jgi:hypothetical protein
VSFSRTPRAVFFNLGSAEPKGSAKILLGSAKYLDISFLIHFSHFSKLKLKKLLKTEQKG